MSIPKPLAALANVVAGADHVVTDAVLDAVIDAFEQLQGAGSDPVRLVPEYAREECLLNVRDDGSPVRASAGFRERVGTHAPAFDHWLREGRMGEQTVLLAGRWLCHCIGLRHRAIHIYLDHPVLPGYTFVQLRGSDKIEAPGRFDIAVGGHIKGTDPSEQALGEELLEELGLDLAADLDGLVHLADYNYPRPRGVPDRNSEYRLVYRARVRADSLARVRFQDGEVAALCLFRVGEPGRLLARSPGRVASGLRGSFDTIYRPRAGG